MTQQNLEHTLRARVAELLKAVPACKYVTVQVEASQRARESAVSIKHRAYLDCANWTEEHSSWELVMQEATNHGFLRKAFEQDIAKKREELAALEANLAALHS